MFLLHHIILKCRVFAETNPHSLRMAGHFFFLILVQRHLSDTVLFFHLCDNLLLVISPPQYNFYDRFDY